MHVSKQVEVLNIRVSSEINVCYLLGVEQSVAWSITPSVLSRVGRQIFSSSKHDMSSVLQVSSADVLGTDFML